MDSYIEVSLNLFCFLLGNGIRKVDLKEHLTFLLDGAALDTCMEDGNIEENLSHPMQEAELSSHQEYLVKVSNKN